MLKEWSKLHVFCHFGFSLPQICANGGKLSPKAAPFWCSACGESGGGEKRAPLRLQRPLKNEAPSVSKGGREKKSRGRRPRPFC